MPSFCPQSQALSAECAPAAHTPVFAIWATRAKTADLPSSFSRHFPLSSQRLTCSLIIIICLGISFSALLWSAFAPQAVSSVSQPHTHLPRAEKFRYMIIQILFSPPSRAICSSVRAFPTRFRLSAMQLFALWQFGCLFITIAPQRQRVNRSFATFALYYILWYTVDTCNFLYVVL